MAIEIFKKKDALFAEDIIRVYAITRAEKIILFDFKEKDKKIYINKTVKMLNREDVTFKEVIINRKRGRFRIHESPSFSVRMITRRDFFGKKYKVLELNEDIIPLKSTEKSYFPWVCY